MTGVVYLVHLSEPLSHSQHYLGFCNKMEGLPSRLTYHAKARGSKFLAAAAAKGIRISLVRLWEGNRYDEKYLKSQKHADRLCPLCGGKQKPRGMKEITLT